MLTLIKKSAFVYSYLFHIICSPDLVKRENFLSGLNQVLNQVEELLSNVKEGNQFYADLLARVQQLFQTVSDYCMTRGVEKNDLIMSMHNEDQVSMRMAGASVNDASRSSAHGPPPSYGSVPTAGYATAVPYGGPAPAGFVSGPAGGAIPFGLPYSGPNPFSTTKK